MTKVFIVSLSQLIENVIALKKNLFAFQRGVELNFMKTNCRFNFNETIKVIRFGLNWITKLEENGIE